MAFLPSAHIAQRVVIELLPIRCGMPVTFFESLLKLPQEIRKVRPTILLAPPRMWERIYSTICTELRKRPAAARKAFYGGAGAGAGGGALPPRRQAGAAAHPRPAEDGRPAAVPQGARALRRPHARGGLRRRAAQQGPGRVLRGHRHAADRRLRPHRGRRGDPQSARPPQARQHRQAAARRRGAVRRRRRAAGEEPLPVFRLLERSGDHRRGAARRLAAHRRHGATSTATATSSSPAARRS